jgi:hypothetical protein
MFPLASAWPPLIFIISVVFLATGKLWVPATIGTTKRHDEKEKAPTVVMQVTMSILFALAGRYRSQDDPFGSPF